ncbi:TetR/AcrR family transcriptional regulator [Streptomyces sp. NBC_00557]|uniref:TetR/AcrR family transcriptional regulator n=1 Tax=Streptomyces sp. NBC_00557 TaxID=2975776 RepID=UPI002E804F9B|nr:hypothetical protein [Streptomyces sp. NBC_00557]WUC36935.1 hypothetical protein OG956_23330 [Streptomyces sp. NBC_00557]
MRHGQPVRAPGARLVRLRGDQHEPAAGQSHVRDAGATNQAGAERMQGIFRDQLLPVARQVCPDPEQVPTRAALCATQLLGLALTRCVLRLPPARELTRPELLAWLGTAVQRYLTAPHP